MWHDVRYGADRGAVLALVLFRGVRMAAAGVSAGAALAFLFVRLAGALLFGVRRTIRSSPMSRWQ